VIRVPLKIKAEGLREQLMVWTPSVHLGSKVIGRSGTNSIRTVRISLGSARDLGSMGFFEDLAMLSHEAFLLLPFFKKKCNKRKVLALDAGDNGDKPLLPIAHIEITILMDWGHGWG
jgi:hypothetical protein